MVLWGFKIHDNFYSCQREDCRQEDDMNLSETA